MSAAVLGDAASSTADGTVATTCPYCGTGCGVRARFDAARGTVAVEGDAAHPSSRGRLCVKGAALGETVGLEGRLLHPLLREPGQLPRRASWDEALQRVADGFRRIIDAHGPDAVAFYVSGQLLTEDYYVVNKLAKGYLGTANIDTNSRLCMSSAVAGHRRAFGEDVVPGCYEDLELAELVVLVGSNTAWCHPIVFQRIVQAKQARPELRVVVIDPRRTASCELADLHLPIAPGTDVWLFNGLLAYLHRHSATDAAYVAAHTDGFDAALAAAQADAAEPAAVARLCGIAEDDLLAFYALFARCEKTVSLFSQGVNQSSAGTDKVNALINCHLLTGRVGRPGAGPFSLTGQPNAMGGREVGGLANLLAAHLELDEPRHRALVQAFWQSPRIAERAGLKAVALFEAIAQGRVKAVWIMATNPVVSLPDADAVKRALAACELVVCSDVTARTDTAAFAHVLLPALSWGEKDGTVTNSERRITRQRPFLPVPGEARADWDIVCDVARRMGYAQGFDYAGAHAIFDEHARLTAFRNHAPRADAPDAAPRLLDLGALAGLDRAGYDALAPVQWPVGADGAGTARLFADGRYAHADGRARFVATPARAPVHAPDASYPLVLNTGRVRDHWHSMTRTGKSPRLAAHIVEPFVELHPHDAQVAGVRDGELARVRSRWGELVARVRCDDGQRVGSVFVPIHWNDQFALGARVGGVVNPALDPLSAQPEFKHTPVRVEPFAVGWHGFALSRRPLALGGLAWWTQAPGGVFTRYELAGAAWPDACADWARAWLGAGAGADWIEHADREAGVYRAVLLRARRLEACVFMATDADALPERAWLASLFAHEALAEADRANLLDGTAPQGGVDVGPIVCACFGVGRHALRAAILEHGCTEPAQLTALLRAGGNCGSCVPELKRLIAAVRAEATP